MALLVISLLKLSFLDMFVAGSDRKFTLIEWTLSELIQHKRAKNEFFFMVDILPFFQLRASSEHLHAIDPGGDNSPKILFTTVFCFVLVSTLRARWILTVEELIR